MRTLHVEHRHALAVADLPFHHRDPFDRLLIVRGQAESMPIATVDETFKKYEVKLLDYRRKTADAGCRIEPNKNSPRGMLT